MLALAHKRCLFGHMVGKPGHAASFWLQHKELIICFDSSSFTCPQIAMLRQGLYDDETIRMCDSVRHHMMGYHEESGKPIYEFNVAVLNLNMDNGLIGTTI